MKKIGGILLHVSMAINQHRVVVVVCKVQSTNIVPDTPVDNTGIDINPDRNLRASAWAECNKAPGHA